MEFSSWNGTPNPREDLNCGQFGRGQSTARLSWFAVHRSMFIADSSSDLPSIYGRTGRNFTIHAKEFIPTLFLIRCFGKLFAEFCRLVTGGIALAKCVLEDGIHA